MLIIIQHMKESAQGFCYNPLSPFCTPFTIISQVKETFISQPMSFPCLYEVYCPYSCKKIKIGLTKDKKVETLQFNTTTNRTVTFYASDSIRYLVNKHRPNKKDKKTVQGQGWSYCIQVQDKGNIAIFNPYCVDPLNPLSFYTFNKICSTDLPKESLTFLPKQQKEAIVQHLGGKQIYFSPDLKWVGLNKYFEENSSQFITVENPNNKDEQISMKTKELVGLANSYLSYYYEQLQKLVELQTKGIQFNENFSVAENIDVIYEKVQFYLTILQQVRARLMNDSCSEAYRFFFPQHPRLYSSLQRLGSFLNYGNSKYSIVELAELGFFNQSDMLQDVSYVQFPHQQIPTIEEEDASTEQQLRKKLFPFARMTKQLPFPNVNLQYSLESMHCQNTTDSEILIRKTLDPYFLLVDKNSKVSIWSTQMMIYKMIEFDLSKNYEKGQDLLIPTSQNQKNAILPVALPVSEPPKVNQKQCVAAQTQKNEQQVKPDENLLQQLKAMGYKENVAKKALIKTKNAEVETVIDAIQQLLKQKSTKKRTSNWKCNICTYINHPTFDKCEMCQQLAPEFEEEEIIAGKKEQQQRLLEEKKKAQEEKLRIQKQKEEKQKLMEEQRNLIKKKLQDQQSKLKVSIVKSASIYRSSKSNIDPFFVIVLLQKPDSNFALRTFRIGLNRKSLLNFYRIQDEYIVSNFTREIIKSKDFRSINHLIGNSRPHIQWGIKLFEPSSEFIWTVIEQQNIDLNGAFTEVKSSNEKISLFNNQDCVMSYEIEINDDLNKPKFSLKPYQGKEVVEHAEKNKASYKTIVKQNKKAAKPNNDIEVDQNIQQICLQITEHVPSGDWKPLAKEKDINISSTIYSQNLIMSEFLPLKIQSHQGSIFSHKYSTTSMLEKSSDKNNVYISNYPDVSFAFKSIDNKPILVESVAIISKNVKMNKIFPISAGLIFTANELSWFTIAKKRFSNITKQEYDNWLKTKQMTNATAAFWQPVAYFQINKNAQAEFQINFKRIAKYVFLLPTSVNKQDNKDDVIAVRIDFFGVKGRVQEELPDAELNDGYKSQGKTSCQLSVKQEDNKKWVDMKSQKFIIKSISSAGSFFFGPKYFNQFADKIPLSVNTVYHIKFKELSHRKQLNLKSSNIISIKVISKKQSKNNIQQLNISSFSQLISKQNKLSDLQLQKVVNVLKLQDLFISLLKGPAEINHFEALLTKILNLHNFDERVVSAMSEILLRMCDSSIVVTDIGFKSFMRFYEKVISLNQQLAKKTIEKAWIEATQFYHKCKNKNYNILRNNYKIEQLVLEPALFNKDYYRLINPNYVEEERTLSITAEPQTPINNRVYIDARSNYNYVYYIDALGHGKVNSIDLYFPKLSPDNRYKISLKLVELSVEKDEVREKQIYYRYFHEDYLLQLSNKAFKETQIFKKTHINYCSIPGSLATPGTRLFKLYFDLMIVTTINNPRFKQLAQPYIILPVISSHGHQELKHQEHPLPQAFTQIFNEYPESTKHNSSLQRMPPHRFANENKKLLYIVHEFKSKINEQVKSQSINKIEKIAQNILDKNIVTQTASSIRINDYGLNYKGLDFAYILMITLMKMFRKLPSSYAIDVKTMFILFDAYIVYECGPIKNQTSSFLTQLYKRLSVPDKNIFVQTIINNYLLDSEKIKNLKISQKYPIQKVIKFLGEFTLPIATLFEKLQHTKSLSAAAILIILISNNSASGDPESLDIYQSNKVVKTFKVHQLINISFKVCIWVLHNASALSSEILELSLNLLLSFLTDKFSSVKVSPQQIKKFVQNLSQEDFWQLIFGTIRKKNDLLNEKIYTIFKTLVQNITENFQRGINNMLLEIIKNNQSSLYEKINPNVTDDSRMNHLQTILEYLSLTNNKIFLDEDTAISLLSLPLTTTLWSLALKIIPRKDKILIEIIKKFSQEHYNTLGKEIMQFCEPLAGIRKLESNHINWLELVRKIRLEGKSIFSLFIEQIRKCNFGGKNSLTMAMPEDCIKLEIAEQFSKLVVENKIQQKDFNQQNIKVLVSWFFMNNSKQKGSSPATDLLFSLSKNVYTIFQKVTELQNVIPHFIKIVLETRKEGQMVETLFEQKKVSSSNALQLNKRFSECFQSLINLLCVNDELYSYFAFEIKGLQYMLEKAGLSSAANKQIQTGEGEAMALTTPQQQFLISQGLVASLSKQSNQNSDKSANTTEIKQQQFAVNVQLVPNKNEHNIVCSSVDWTAYKKGNKNKIIFLPMNGPTHHQYPLHVSLSQACEVRSIKIGFPAASFEMADKLIASPSFVLLEGGMDLKNLQSMGEMEEIDDDGYASNGVRVFVLNAQKIKNSKLSIDDAINTMPCHRVKYLKIIVKRPVVSFIQGQFSPLNGKPYTNLGCNISFLSVLGDNFQKRKLTLLNSCKEISRTSALTILGTVINEANPQTVKRISDSEQFVMNFKNKFNTIQEHMVSYPNIVPHIVYSLGSSNEKLGDWIIDKFLSEGNGDIQAKLLNQILMSSEKRIYNRLDIFLKHILNKIHQIINQSDIQSNIKFVQSLFFIESFCKTLQESYDFGIAEQTTLNCSFKNIEEIITLYDKKYSSPEIKTFNRLLINLLYLRSPIKLSEDVGEKTLNLVWQNCSEAKPYFYLLLGSLILNKKNRNWVKANGHEKLTKLFSDLNKSIESNSLKIINPQMFLMWIISFHESQIIVEKKMHLELYNKIKNLVVPNFEIFDHLMKLIQNVVIGNQNEERDIASQLIEDVDLLVKRKDPNLQQLYVGILRLERQINVNIKGFDVDSQNNKKESFLTSKILNKAQIKLLSQKINKKIKFSPIIQSQNGLKTEFFDKVYNAINASQFLMIIKFKLLSGKYGYFGCYSPGKAFRSQEDSYCWEDVMNYEKGSFIFHMSEGETKFIETNETNQQMISLCGGQDEMDQSIIFYDKSAQIVKLPFSLGAQNNIVLANFVSAQAQSVQVYSGVLKASTVEPKILASSSKASIPFNYYRTSNVYIFPFKINIQKFMSIIGIRGVCKDKNRKISPDQVLGAIGQETDDFIADVEIQVQQSDDKQKQQQGYFPTMRIFDKFSQLGGVNKVLEIGSQSIKDWQKAERRKNFEHYMSQLRNFVHLPSFFNHYIKHQESITFLFEVASGMPDDPNNEKNWEQQQIKSSKFIYKILADIYKYDKTLQIRDMSKYSEFCDLILQKLAQISKQTVRSSKEVQATQASQQAEKTGEAQKTGLNAVKQKKKKKGIGYSNDNQNSSKWSATEWIEHRKNMNQQIQRVASIFVSFLDCEKPLTDHKLSDIIKNSCLLPLIESALRSGSLLDISKEADLFRNYLNIIKSLSANPATIDCLLDIDPKYKPAQTESIYKLLTKLHAIAEIFIDCLKSGKTSQQNETAAVIAGEIEKTFNLVDRAVKNLTKKTESITIKQINSMPTGQAYRFLLGGLRFGYVDMKKTPGKDEYAHFYASTIPKGSPPTAKILRLSQQLADLSSSLPCEHTNSIFVRCDRSRIDVIKILIMGSKDTPYSNGAFMFDLFCEDSYPNNPPKMSITTTGSGKIRFNPNLYACGKVCLSLLGTWRGQASENWDAKISTLLQLFISTQGITMSEDLYFNEPGFDSEQGTVEGQRKNEAYANIVRIGNVRHAINEQIKNPPKGFEDVVNRHFYVKQKQILQEIQKWIEQADTKQASYTGLVNDHNTSWCNQLKVKGKYKQLLLKQYNQLKTLLQKLPEPNLHQKQQEVNFETQKAKKKTKVAKQIKLGEIDVSYEPEAEKQLVYEEGVMQDRWSRYIGAMGIQAVKKQAESKVILVGLRPLGLQIAKNLVLSGLKQLCIVDQGAYGMGSEEHFYMSDTKNNKIEQCIYKVKELNPYMLVKCEKEIPNLTGYHVLVSTQPFKQALELSAICRKNNIKFVYAQTCGVSGIYFSDLGKQFSVEDPHGEEPFEGLIKQISCDKQGIVKLLDGVKHPYQDGDYVVIDNVEGMKEKQQKIEEESYAQSFYNDMAKSKKTNTINGRVFEIKVINWNSFSIGDTTNFQPYIKNGLCKNINIPKKIKFLPLQQCATDFDNHLDPSVGIYDFEKMGDNYSVFACSQAFSDFIQKNKRKPKNWQLKDAQQFEEILKKILEKDKKTEQQIQSILKFGRKYALISQAQLPVIGAYFGGIVSQQIVKAITNKYTPIKQFFTFHFNELIQQIPQNQDLIKDLQIKQTQLFPNLKIIIGKQNSKKVEQVKAFVIGAGAIGCELLKNFAMANMGAEGMITVTDPDHIETSNLTRQFLFRQKHVKKPKSATAAATLIQMNPLLKNHISARLDKVSQLTEDIYSDQFYDTQTIIANALDNVKARVYVDSRCVINAKPLFESGTLGPKGHVQVIIPHKTQNYGNQTDPTQQNQIPHCTLKMFPEQTVHCIEWSRDIFGKVFTLNPKALKKVIQAKDLLAAEGQQKTTVIRMLEHKPTNFDDCVAQAVRKFYKYFRNNVRQLLHTYPIDMKTKDGNLFWTLPKRPPKQIKQIDFTDLIHQKFIVSYAVLLAKIYQIPFPKDFRNKEGMQKIMGLAKQIKPQQFVPSEQQSQKLQKMTENQEKGNTMQEQVIEPPPKQQETEVKTQLTNQSLEMNIKPQQFEKDQDSNGHIDLIYAMSNLRSRNYGLNECTWIQAKLKAGKIMAALSTTTSVVAALQTIQIIKLVAGSKSYRNSFINLAVPLIQISEPGQVPKHKIGNAEFTVWDTWEFKAESIKDLLKQIEDKHDVEGYNLSTAGGVPIYWEAMYADKEQAKQELLNRPLNKIFQEKTTLNVLMRSKSQDKKPFENLPRVIVTPITN